MRDELTSAYEFLRRVEHRIQYLDDQQTHVLPMDCEDECDERSQDGDLRWISRTMGYADCCPFLHELDAHREFVARETLATSLELVAGDELAVQVAVHAGADA